jgi:hypothetical protein
MKKLTFLVLSLFLCGPDLGVREPAVEPAATPSTSPGSDAALRRARGAADALGGELMKRLLHELSEAGPLGALRVCSEIAPSVAASHSGEGLSVRRVSVKARNPAGSPDDFERAKLEELDVLHRAEELPAEIVEVVEENDRRVLRYMRPIVIRRPCLQCHGHPATMDGEVLALIDKLYPEDRARGYENRDLRGAISAVVELD